LWGLKRHFSPFKLVVIIISNFEAKEQVEKGAIEKGIEQLVKVEQSTDLSLERIKEQYFDIDTNSPNIPVIVPTKAQSKCMMRCKGKKLVEEGVSSAKVTKK
jgi:hypothetical protein